MVDIPEDFDEELYCSLNPDVAAEVEAGLTTASLHWTHFGYKESRAIRRPQLTSELGGGGLFTIYI